MIETIPLKRSPLTVWECSPHEERNFTIIVYAVAVVVLRHRREFDGYETVVTTALCVSSCSKRNATLQSAIGQRRIER